ncbi:MAG: hypothetical protein QXQ66_09440, partial [Candidatus Hadarchaeum sp.]
RSTTLDEYSIKASKAQFRAEETSGVAFTPYPGKGGQETNRVTPAGGCSCSYQGTSYEKEGIFRAKGVS